MKFFNKTFGNLRIIPLDSVVIELTTLIFGTALHRVFSLIMKSSLNEDLPMINIKGLLSIYLFER